MSGHRRSFPGARVVRVVAWVALYVLYPPASRGYMGRSYADAAEHRWLRERHRSGATRALWRTVVWLVTDTVRAAPSAWRDAFRHRTSRGRMGRRSGSGWTGLGRDLRLVLRRLSRAPGFTSLALATLALTIGATATILGIGDAVLFRPLPYTDVDRLQLVEMEQRVTGARYLMVRYAYLQAIEDHGELGEVALAEPGESLVVRSEGGAAAIPAMKVTANYFAVLGVEAFLGRLFRPADAAEAGRVAVLSHAAWVERFGGNERLVGSSVALGGHTFDVIGVLPPGFFFPLESAGRPEVITAMAAPERGATGGTFHPVLRLAPGVSRQRAQNTLDALAAPLADPSAVDAGTLPVLVDVRSSLFATGGPVVRLLLLSAALVLVLGAANLAALLLVRSKRHEKETGVRLALGASAFQLVRTVVLEATVLSMVGACLATVLAAASFHGLLRWVPPVAYGAAPVGVDRRVIAFTLLLGLVVGLAFSVLPAWLISHDTPQRLVRGAGITAAPSHGLLGRPLVGLQVALAMTLVFAAAITGRAAVETLRAPFGFEPAQVALLSIAPPDGSTGRSAEAFYREVLEMLRARGDVVAAGAAGTVPLVRPAPWDIVPSPSRGEALAGVVQVLPGFFRAAGIPLDLGRAPTEADADGRAAIAVVSVGAARRIFPGLDPSQLPGHTFADHGGRTVTVVGVARDVQLTLHGGNTLPPVFVLPGTETRRLTILVRTRSRDARVLEALRREVAALAPDRVVTAGWWSDAIGARTEVRNPRFQALVLGGFAVLALILTALGILGLVAFLVTARTREMGIRLALGGTPRSLVRHALGYSLPPVAAGLAVGLVMTGLGSRVGAARLLSVGTDDPAALAAAVTTVLGAALLAAWLPARRAARVDPVQSLQAE